ncbi:cytochrome P450 [Mycobacterium avium]|nr:cytochrome P450 [Mycobacterium avium]APA74585.3 cytochrome P450 [Mycobacterium avium subsp. hominissuis]ATO61551.2 cytochrome P450 [Mycobacterium avium subsp. hominissuis]ATO69626.1 cytochrome P450 [Mycobacterium avium subsp. hominissuis]ATO70688.2 cytochrome P450 [Mycobacterium avium subsp. hominissuis]
MVATGLRTFRDVPKVPLHSFARDGRKLLRPGAATSPLTRFGDRFVIDAPFVPPMMMTRSVEDARSLFTDPAESWSFGGMLQRFSAQDVLLGHDAFIFLDGEPHRAERKELSPHFRGRALKSYEALIADVVHRRVNDWPTDTPISFLSVGYRLSLDVMISIVFGITQPARAARLERALHNWFAAQKSRTFRSLALLAILAGGRVLPYPPLRRTAHAVDEICLEEIAERRAGRGLSGGVIEQLLVSNDARANPRDDASVARVLRGCVLGYETTAVTLAWVAELVSHHHGVLAELERTVDSGDDSYLEAVIDETLRHRPAIPVTGRRALRSTVLNGINIPQGAAVMVPILAIHEDPDLYQQPEQFKPERFIGDRPGTYTYLPFGAGAHRCLGARLATLEAKVLLRTLMQYRTFTPLPGPVCGAAANPSMLFPANGGRVVLRRR